MRGKIKVVVYGTGVLVFCAVLLGTWVGTALSAEKTPVTRYWMNVSTEKGGFPGVTPGSTGIGTIIGSIIGKAGGDSGKRLRLQLDSPLSPPADPQATHDIPPGQNMGDTLPLVVPDPGRDSTERPEGAPGKMEKPKMRLVVYWGCSETVRPGQPYALDTEKTSPAEFGRVFQGRYTPSPNAPSLRPGRAYAEWPNKKNSKRVPGNSSLAGNHLVHGNYAPDMQFSIDPGHDFMAPVDFISRRGSPAESFSLPMECDSHGYRVFCECHGARREDRDDDHLDLK